MLREILLRLPPRPSSLPLASLVCKRWRSLVADPRFQRRFRDHHGKPPLLGFFIGRRRSFSFVPTLDRPDRIPEARFTILLHEDDKTLDSRHGLVLLLSRPLRRLVLWDPVAREQRRLILPLELDNGQTFIFNGALHRQHVIVEFDLDNQSLAVTEVPATVEPDCRNLWIMPAEDGGLGLIHISQFHGRLWKRKPDSDGLAVWVLYRAIDFDVLRSTFGGYSPTLVGVAEESKAIIVVTTCGVFMVYLQSMEFKKLSDEWSSCLHYPFACFYPAVVGTAIVDGHDGDEKLKQCTHFEWLDEYIEQIQLEGASGELDLPLEAEKFGLGPSRSGALDLAIPLGAPIPLVLLWGTQE
uniref:Uncharacterized protein n=1 Tax=Aegilops tauschii TaxID=37682 RepID=M8CSA7_AEGTA